MSRPVGDPKVAIESSYLTFVGIICRALMASRSMAFSLSAHLCFTATLNWQWNGIQDMDPLNFGSLIVSLSGAVLLKYTCPTWGLTSTSFVSSQRHVASASSFVACILINVSYILMLSFLWTLSLLIDRHLIAYRSVMSLWVSASRSPTCFLMVSLNSVWAYRVALITASIFSWPAHVVASVFFLIGPCVDLHLI